jgi:hypothetical protein
MCRSIKQLRGPAQPPSDEEVQAAALQFVRKVSGYRAPSQKNRAAFEQAVAEIAASTRALLEKLGGERPPEEARPAPARSSVRPAARPRGQARKETTS